MIYNNLKYYGFIGLIFLISCNIYKDNTISINDQILEQSFSIYQIDTNNLVQNAKRYIINGSVKQQQKKHAEAILDFLEALRYDNSASIYYAIAYNCEKLGRYELAKMHLQEAIKRNPNFIDAYKLLASIYLNNFEFDKALYVYEKIVELKPTYENQYYLANLYILNNKNKNANDIFLELIKKNNDPDIILEIATYYESINDQLEAKKYYDMFSYFMEPNKKNYQILMNYFIRTNEYDKALNLLDSANFYLYSEDLLSLFDDLGNNLLNLSYKDTNVNYIISSYLSKIDERYFDDLKIILTAGFLAFKINDTILANKYFEKVMSAEVNEQIPIKIAYFYYYNNLVDKAIEIIKNNHSKFQTNYNYPLALSYFYYAKGSIKESLIYANQAYSLELNSIEIMSQLAIIYDNLKKYDSSEYFYKKILRIEPDNSLINNNYAYSLAEREEQLEYALELSKMALEVEPENPSFLDTYGWIQYKLGNYEVAEHYFLKALNFDTTNFELYEHLGFLYFKLDNFEKAVEYFEKSLINKPDNEKVINMLKKINK